MTATTGAAWIEFGIPPGPNPPGENYNGYCGRKSKDEKRNSRSGSQTAARRVQLHSARARAQTRGEGQSRRLPGKRTAPSFVIAAVADCGHARARQKAAVPAGASGSPVDRQ